MPSKTKIVLNSFLIVSLFSIITISPAFADHSTAKVSIPEGTYAEGCEKTKACFIPYEVTVDVGGAVTWENADSAAHTVTSGTENLLSGHFDSQLFYLY